MAPRRSEWEISFKVKRTTDEPVTETLPVPTRARTPALRVILWTASAGVAGLIGWLIQALLG